MEGRHQHDPSHHLGLGSLPFHVCGPGCLHLVRRHGPSQRNLRLSHFHRCLFRVTHKALIMRVCYYLVYGLGLEVIAQIPGSLNEPPNQKNKGSFTLSTFIFGKGLYINDVTFLGGGGGSAKK